MSRQHFNVWKPSFSNPSLLSLLQELRAQLRGCETVLDVGCGGASPLRYLRGFRLIGVDGYAPAVDEATLRRTHDEVILADVLKLGLLLKGRKFGACVALDLIEHLKKEDGYRLLDDLESLATRKVIISTPNGFLPQKSHDGDLQEHLSGWTPDDMQQRGYKVIGMYGPKSLRGEYHRIKRQPRAFWLLVSLTSHYLHTRAHPEKAAAIFCVKNVQR